jgi:sugar/nucleoside kinase (ribokinase family)
VDSTDAFFYTSNTMLAADELQVTRAARLRAAEQGRPVIYDPNLRTDRWENAAEAIELAREGVAGALLVKANRTEAGLLTGIEQPLGAAQALLTEGAQCAVVTLGPDGAVAAFAGGGSIEAPGERARPVCTTGAGDTVSGVLLAALAAADFDVRAVEEALPRAVEAAARATERWGAV